MCKRGNAFSRPVLIRRGLDDLCAPAPLCSLEGTALERFPVAPARGKHLFPFRTESLSPSAPMVLRAKARGRVGRRRDQKRRTSAGRTGMSPGRPVVAWRRGERGRVAAGGGDRRYGRAGPRRRRGAGRG